MEIESKHSVSTGPEGVQVDSFSSPSSSSGFPVGTIGVPCPEAIRCQYASTMSVWVLRNG